MTITNILPIILFNGSGSLFQETIQRSSRFQSPIILANEDNNYLITEKLRQIEMQVDTDIKITIINTESYIYATNNDKLF